MSKPCTRSEREERKIIRLSRRLEDQKSDNQELRGHLRDIHFLISKVREQLESKDSKSTLANADIDEMRHQNRRLSRDLGRTYSGVETLVSHIQTVESQHEELNRTHQQVLAEVREAHDTIERLKRRMRASRKAAAEQDEERQLENRRLKCLLERANKEAKTLRNLLLLDNIVHSMPQ